MEQSSSLVYRYTNKLGMEVPIGIRFLRRDKWDLRLLRWDKNTKQA